MTTDFLSQITGSFALPARENPTVAMVEAAYRHHHHLNWRYLNCEVTPDNLGDAVRGARAMGWAGFNCSIPHKVAVIKHLDSLGRSAELIGAVNTIVRRGDRFEGENTDGRGFVQALRAAIDPMGKNVVLFGAGGAARAVGVELALAGATQIQVVNRNPQRGKALASLIDSHTPANAEYQPWRRNHPLDPQTHILINATSIGLYPDIDGRLDLDLTTLSPHMVVADGIHNPPTTALIRDARDRGCQTVDGLAMLVNQSVIGIRYWTGVDVDTAVMREALNHCFGRNTQRVQ